jgi:hypothetical protein
LDLIAAWISAIVDSCVDSRRDASASADVANSSGKIAINAAAFKRTNRLIIWKTPGEQPKDIIHLGGLVTSRCWPTATDGQCSDFESEFSVADIGRCRARTDSEAFDTFLPSVVLRLPDYFASRLLFDHLVGAKQERL